MNPIPTMYAGCEFRSRLEARWALFFDELEIEWHYEPEGFVVGLAERRYLPDFVLPRHNVWIEVKGDVGKFDFGLMLDAVDYGLGLPIKGETGGLLLLGPVPKPSRTVEPAFPYLTHRKGVQLDAWLFSRLSGIRMSLGVASADGTSRDLPDEYVSMLKGEATFDEASPAVSSALSAARSAKFEHDQRETW